MGCCGRKKKKAPSTSNVTKKNSNKKIENQTSVKNEQEKKKIVSVEKIDKPKVEEKQVVKTEPIISEEPKEHPKTVSSLIEQPIVSKEPKENPKTVSSLVEQPIEKAANDDFIEKLLSNESFPSIKTFHQLQKSVEEKKKPVSILLFYGQYCPYSKRTLPGLRQWAQANQDRIELYEIDVKQDSQLAEYYHVRTIPTIMAFDEQNLVAPIWQRTSKNVLPLSSMEEFEPIEEKFEKTKDIYVILDPKKQNKDQYLNSLDRKASETISDQSSRRKSVEDLSSQSVASSEQSPYLWNQSSQATVTESSKHSVPEYHGRMISESTLMPDEQFRKKRTWSDFLNETRSLHDYHQHIHLPNCHEIFYEKEFDNFQDFNHSISSDRFSTLTYQHVRDTNYLSEIPEKDFCILYLGPNRNRGFEDNQPDKRINPSKASLLTLQSTCSNNIP